MNESDHLIRPCFCGRNMIPHHRQIHKGIIWWVCESLNCQYAIMTADPRNSVTTTKNI
jgi:hypothetical protein